MAALRLLYGTKVNSIHYSYRVTEDVSRHVATSPAEPDAPDAFRFAESGKLAAIVKEAGAIDVGECVVKFYVAAPISPEEFWVFRSEISEVLREKLKTLSSDEKPRIADEVLGAVIEFFPGGHMRFPATDDYCERDKTERTVMSYRILVYVSLSILLTLAASNCAQTETQVQSPTTSPREIWKFETGG